MSFIPVPAIFVIDFARQGSSSGEGNERRSCVCPTAGAIGYSNRLRVRRAIAIKRSGLAETSAD